MFGHAALLTSTGHDKTALRHQPRLASALLTATFDQSDAAGDALVDIPKIRIIAWLHAMEPDIVGQIGNVGLEIDRLAFVVGRAERKPIDGDAPGVNLGLDDKGPFNLSRRHFAIANNGPACWSGIAEVITAPSSTASPWQWRCRADGATTAGENEIIAGNADSPFRFTLTISRS